MIKFILLLMAIQNTNSVELAKMVAAECSICTDEEQMYVAHTIINRISSPDYPNNVSKVLSQEGQYTTPVKNLKGFERVYVNVKIYKGLFGNFKNVTYFCLDSTNDKGFLEFVQDGGFKMTYHWFK